MTKFGDPDLQPETVRAADGIHVLQRFRVEGVIYAPTLKEAEARLEHCLEIDIGQIIQEVK